MTFIGALFIFLSVLFLLFIALWLIGERGKLLRESTWNFMKAAGLRRNLNLSTLHAYAYARWLKQYIGILGKKIIPNASPAFRKWWTDRFHGKIVVTECAKTIVRLDRKLSIEDLEQIVPYPTARRLVIDGPPDVVAFECACRANAENPCEPTRVCMVIGKPFTDFILEHHPQESTRLSHEEALELLEAEHARGHFHTAWFKDVMMDRFYAICNCCKCCCLGLDNMVNYGARFMSSSGYVAKVEEDICDGCGECAEFCPFGAVEIDRLATVDTDRCMGCGVCVGRCSNQALSLNLDETRGLPLDVRLLSENKEKVGL